MTRKYTALGIVAAGGVTLAIVLVILAWLEKAPMRVAEVEGTPPVFRTDPNEEALKVVLNQNASDEERVLAVKRLGRSLNPDQIARLRELVRRKGEHPTLRNNVLSLLEMQQLHRPTDLGRDLIAMWKDETEDAIWRDYCLQHMEKVYDYDRDKRDIEMTLLEAARNAESARAGTAMLALERLGARHPALGREAAELAREVMLSGGSDQERMVTALQVARAAGDRSVLERARELAADRSAIPRLRMSAISTIGELGEEKDIALLERLCLDPEPRVKRVAAYQLTSLKEKLSKKIE